MNFYISGLNGTVSKGLGLRLHQEGMLNDYIELTDPFNQLRFSEKVRIIREKILGFPIEEPLNIVAVSFGGYLALNALQELNLENIRLLLISPVLGIFSYEGGGRIPPGYNKFKKLLSEKRFRLPHETQLLYGSSDPVCTDEHVSFFCANNQNVNVTRIEEGGHLLPHDIVFSEVGNERATLIVFLNF